MNERHPNHPDNQRDDERRHVHQEVEAPITALSEQTLAVDLARTEIDQLIATAHKFPRNLDVFERRLSQAVLRNEASAENAVYALPRAGKEIVGPSIGFANALASSWGNCWDYGRWIHTDRREKVVVAEGVFVDWETNRRLVISDQRRIVDSKGRLYSDDMIIVTSKACASIARRNVILNAVPRVLWFPIWEKALYIVRGSEATLATRREAAIKALAHYGVTPKQILLYLGKRDIGEIGVEHMPTLRGMFQSLREGATSVEELFDPRKMTGMNFDQVANPLDDDAGGDEGLPAGGGSPPRQSGSDAAGGRGVSQPRTPPAASEPEPGSMDDEGDLDPEDPGLNAAEPAGQDDRPEDGPATAGKQAPGSSNDNPLPDGPDAPLPSQQGATGAGKTTKATRKAPATAAKDPAPAEAKPAAPAEPDPDVFDNPKRRTGTEYLVYAYGWMGRAKSAAEVDDRAKSEREIRNSLGTPLNEDQFDEFRKAKVDAEARLKAGR